MLHIAPILRTMLRRKLSVFLVVVQIAIATAIFSNLAFIIHRINLEIARPTGFNENQLFTVTLRPLDTSNYANIQFDLNSIEQLPGVEHAAYMRRNPLFSGSNSGRAQFKITPELDASAVTVYKVDVSEKALPALGLNIIRGRDFTTEDMRIESGKNGDGPKNIIISQTLAESLFGKNESYVGKVIYEDNMPREIIGISEDSLGFSRPDDEPAEKTAFYPHINDQDTELRYLIRTKSSQQLPQLIEDVSTMLRRNYQNQLFLYVEKIEDLKKIMDRNNNVFKYQLIVIIIILGLVVAFAISGQTLFNVNQRTKQIGIRRALGASRNAIIREILNENALICCLGLMIGILLSIGVNQIVMQELSGWPAISPIFIIITCLALLTVCLASAAAPAWQAGKISPSVATRTV